MFDYTGHKCPYCEEEFKGDSDIAVCPDCGTPHHRGCYSEHKACSNEQKHAESFDWQSVNATNSPSLPGETLQCPSCGREIASGSKFCNYCGESFSRLVSPYDADSDAKAKTNYGTAFPPPPDFGYYNGKSETDNKKPLEFNGIPVADWLKYIGRSASYYLTFFQVQDKSGRKSSFTLSAMLFPGLYFLYRKVWGFAALAALISVVLGAPYLIILLSESGILSGFDLDFWNSVSTYTMSINLITNFMWGTFAVYIYRRTATKKLKRLKLKSATEQEYQSRLEKISGPSLTAVVAPFFILFTLTNVLSLFNLF